MKLSIIIVNYNVEFFLEQCLLSVEKALKGINGEIWVVDNNSVDYSIRMLESKFPNINLIANKENVGFAVANNQAIKKAKGDYILLLNPDTIVEEDTFNKVLVYMAENPNVGGLGVKMLDGKGNFLAESKRGLPTPIVAFYKIFGLARLFPKSKVFGRYHLGYLDKDQIQEVDVLAGAFMLISKKVLDEIGLLDESFFMYGEDIDLSYRITKAGYKNVYFPKISIIHFKGESTKKSSTNYVIVFYKAMALFAQKHFSKNYAGLFYFLINLAIFTRASIAILFRAFQKTYLPIIDIILMYGGIYFIQDYWERSYLTRDAYPWFYEVYVLPIYIIIWMLSSLYSGAYDRPYRLWQSIKGIGFGTVIILIIYALLPESLRFSRAIILFSTIWAMFSLSLLRVTFGVLKVKDFIHNNARDNRIAILGEINETRRVAELLGKTSSPPGFIGLVNSNDFGKFQEGVIGDLKQLEDLIAIYSINELVFCSESIDASEIISQMTRFNTAKLSFKIAPHKSSAVIGSQSISQASNLYMIDINGIQKPNNKRVKRLFDFLISLLILILSPIVLLKIKQKKTFFPNIISVLLGYKSLVGYDLSVYNKQDKLPSIKEGILFPKDAFQDKEISTDVLSRLNLMYSQDYKPKNDFQILLKAFPDLGRKD